MTTVLVILFVLIVLASIITTIMAIIQIVKNDFSGSKVLWILVSMIVLVGPILYLIKGRKLIIKREYNEINSSEGFLLQSHYKGLLRESSAIIKISLSTAFVLIISGYLLRGFDIFIFWESKQIGYLILLICILILLRKDIDKRKNLKVENTFSHIGFWLITLFLFVKTINAFTLPNSDPCIVAKDYCEKDSILISEIGDIKSFTVLPSGQIDTESDSSGTSGVASLNLIVKGTVKFKELEILLIKFPESNWTVKEIY